MTIFQPSTDYSNAIARPICSKCGATMMLSRIEPDSPGHDMRTFECTVSCGHSRTEIVKFG